MKKKKLSKILKGRQYCLFTTFKKDGTAVASPMWFALDGEVCYMTTRGHSWKVKRIQNDPRVSIGWSNASGTKHGKLHEGTATLVWEGSEFQLAVKLLNKKYGLKKKIVDFGLRFAKDRSEVIVKVEFE